MVSDVRDAIVRADVEEVADALAPDVVWVGVLPRQVCRNREQVLEIFRRALDAGRVAKPEIVAEIENMLVVDPHLEPAAELNPTLHQVYVVDEEQIVELRDYPDRRTALAAVGLSE
jgi:ketosteroid isomerase-like protein